MSNDTPSNKPPRWKPLAPNPRRVLGVLIEKAKTTPAVYPLSVQAIVTGCNQKSNREPVTEFTDEEVEQALRDLEAAGVVEEIDWTGRVNKYRHKGYEWLGVNRVEMAVMAELLLRGEQSLADLRVRAERMETIPDPGALKAVVDGLIQRGLVIELTPPGRGHLVSHNLYSAPELTALRNRSAAAPQADGGPAASAPRAVRPDPPSRAGPAPGAGAAPGRVAALSARVAELRAEVAGLRREVAELARRRAPGPDAR